MFKSFKRFLPYGAATLVLGVLIIVAPRAAHAVAATLVQVTNTSVNPAITQSAPTQAAQLVNLYAADGGTGGPYNLYLLSPNGITSPYVVPANQSLVITAVDITPVPLDTANVGCALPSVATLYSSAVPQTQIWRVSGFNTLHFDYPSGSVLAPGSTPEVSFSTQNNCDLDIVLHGYLTTN